MPSYVDTSLKNASYRHGGFYSLFAGLLVLAAIALTFSPKVQAQEVEIGSGTLDHAKVVAPRWVRVDFDALITGDNTLRIVSDASVSSRFSVFQRINPDDAVRIGTSSGTPDDAQWSGSLDTAEEYYLGVWATSGTGEYTATIDADVAVDPLEIVSQPVGVTVAEGDDATFSVMATGSGTLTYQWLLDGVAIAGATSDMYTVSPTALSDDGNVYSVDITDDNGSLSSATATLSVETLIGLEIVSQPVGVTVTEGDDATFSVVATGSGTLTYQWFLDGVAITGATADTYIVSTTALSDDGNVYSVDITDDNGSLSSATATLNVDTLIGLEIVSQPMAVTVAEGDGATFSVVATGSGTLTYQWLLDGVAIAGATSDTYIVSPAALSDDGNMYSVDITDDNGALSSTTATLSVETLIGLEIVSQPVGVTVTEGDDATFSVAATGSGTLTYQWFVNDLSIVGATSDTYTVSPTALTDDGSVYRVDITDDNGSLSSDSVFLDVLEIIVPVTTVIIGQGTLDSTKAIAPRWVRVDFDSLAAATHTITVDWDSTANVKYKVFEANGTLISSTIQGTNPGVWSGDLDADAQYYIGLWSTNGIANYDVTIEASVPVLIDVQPDDRIVTENDDVTFFVEATGSGTLSYQWLANNNPILGETGDSLTVFATTLAEDGNLYSVEISNGIETVVSDAALLTVNETLILGLFSQEVDSSTWMLEGPAPTLDYDAGANTDAWGKTLLRVGDMLLVGGDFQGIKPTRFATPTARPFLAALDAISGQPITSFQVPPEVDSVVRALALSPNGEQVYVGGDFGFLALDADTGALDFDADVTKGANDGRVFDIAVTGSQIYIGGDFTNVDNTYRANIARLSLTGALDTTWNPKVTHGFTAGRSAPVQSLAVSSGGDIVYVGGNFRFIDGTPVMTTAQNSRISMLSVSALDGSVLPERFYADVGNNAKGLTAHDIAVTDFYVIIAWGGPNYVSFHSLDGTRLAQYRAKGDVQSLQVVGDHVIVGHHGEFFNTLVNPNPPEAVVSLDPEVIKPFKIHSFRIDDPSFLPEQAWEITGAFGVWGIAASADSIWVAGQISLAGSNARAVDGLVRFPAL